MPVCKNAANAYYIGSEPSPKGNGWCARVEEIGKIRKGTDGNKWVVKGTANGSKRWVMLKDSAPTVMLKDSAPTPSFRIRVCEVSTYNHNRGVDLTVTKSFIQKLLAAPTTLRKASGYENAYIFGKRYPFDTYVKVGRHKNDVAQTGVLILDDKGRVDPDVDIDALDKLATRFKYNWDNRAFLRLVRKTISPTVVFIGQTDGGDAGATVYVHRVRGHIDSLIIDNHYFSSE